MVPFNRNHPAAARRNTSQNTSGGYDQEIPRAAQPLCRCGSAAFQRQKEGFGPQNCAGPVSHKDQTFKTFWIPLITSEHLRTTLGSANMENCGISRNRLYKRWPLGGWPLPANVAITFRFTWFLCFNYIFVLGLQRRECVWISGELATDIWVLQGRVPKLLPIGSNAW